MNILLTTFIILNSTFYLLQAQDGYIKYYTDYEYSNNTIRVFKNEIVPYLNTSKSNRISVIVGSDTITDLQKDSEFYSPVTEVNMAYLSQKEDYLQLRVGGYVWVNASEISKTDTVTLIAESGDILTQLIERREALVKQTDLGESFRLIITNSPTIFYSTDNLKVYVMPESVQETANVDISKEGKNEANWTWLFYALVVLGAGVIGFIVWRFFKKSIDKSDNYVYFNYGSLTEFAKQYGGLDFLSFINPKGLIPSQSEWVKIKNRGHGRSLMQKLKGKKIRVKQKEKTIFGFYNVDVQRKEKANESRNGLQGQLKQMEINLTSEIKKLSIGNNNNIQLSELTREKLYLEAQLKTIRNEKQTINNKLIQLQSDKTNSEIELDKAKNETIRVNKVIRELSERVIVVDFLKGYSESVFSYFKHCQQVSIDAYNFYNKIKQQYPKQAFTVSHLLLKFQSAVNAIPIGDWLRTVQDIKDSGATTNRQITRSFSQIQTDGDKQKEFQRLLFSEALTIYSSNILILAEAFKNLSRFQVSADFANEAQSTFGKHVTVVVSMAKSIGLDIKYVPLFESWEKYLGQVEDNGGERSLAYKEIGELEKGAIVEIVSYGVKTPLGEDTKTVIILA